MEGKTAKEIGNRLVGPVVIKITADFDRED